MLVRLRALLDQQSMFCFGVRGHSWVCQGDLIAAADAGAQSLDNLSCSSHSDGQIHLVSHMQCDTGVVPSPSFHLCSLKPCSHSGSEPHVLFLLHSYRLCVPCSVQHLNRAGKLEYSVRALMRLICFQPQGVRDVKFNHDGTRFLSTGYDKNVRLWDTETGQVLRTFNTGAGPSLFP